MRQSEAFGRITRIFYVKVDSLPEVDSACTCDEWSYGGGGGWVFGGIDGTFRTPSGWTSSAPAEFWEPFVVKSSLPISRSAVLTDDIAISYNKQHPSTAGPLDVGAGAQ